MCRVILGIFFDVAVPPMWPSPILANRRGRPPSRWVRPHSKNYKYILFYLSKKIARRRRKKIEMGMFLIENSSEIRWIWTIFPILPALRADLTRSVPQFDVAVPATWPSPFSAIRRGRPRGTAMAVPVRGLPCNYYFASTIATAQYDLSDTDPSCF